MLCRLSDYIAAPQEKSDGLEPPAYWPSKGGHIVVDNVTAKYAPHLDSVLRGVSFTIKSGERLAVVGRVRLWQASDLILSYLFELQTGAGKSTLSSLFLRAIEIESGQGRILIDGLDIAKVKLATLRQRITLLPQEPSLFNGTVRFNVDPLNLAEDQEVWSALQVVGLCGSDEGKVTSLDMEVEDEGKNFSLGPHLSQHECARL